MKTIINFFIFNLLLFAVTNQCFALRLIAPLTKEEAKGMGIEVRAKLDTDAVRLELEFTPEGKLKQFTHVELSIREGEKSLVVFAGLLETRSSSGSVVVTLTVGRAYLEKTILSIVMHDAIETGDHTYELRMKDFVELEKSANSTTPLPNQPANAQLHRREVNLKNPGGKDLIMTFEELRRDEKTSTATVKRVSGASVPSAMFVLRGAYDIARARGAAYFINLKEWEGEDGARMYLVGFAPDKNVNPQEYFGLTEPLADDPKHQFFAIKIYERIFKDQP